MNMSHKIKKYILKKQYLNKLYMSQKLTVVESNNNYYPVYYNIYDSMYECKKIEYTK